MGLFKNKNKHEDFPVTEKPDSQPADAGDGITSIIDEELIAVIAAAVAAYEAEQFTQTLYIRKLNRAAGIRPAWGAAGTSEAIDMRRM